MVTSAISGANAYAKIAQLADNMAAGKQAKIAPEKAGSGFSELVETAVQNLVETGQESDQKVVALAQGKAHVVDVVTAIAETEVALETMVSVRDRVISAYQEILRMPI